MQRYSWALTALVVSGGLLLLAIDSDARGQTPKTAGGAEAGPAKQVDILTVDKVELKGKYFASNKEKAPCVLLLHAIGESSSSKDWTNLAVKLNEKGFAVLMFDFRGHGDSTTVRPGVVNPKDPTKTERGFWDEPLNQRGVKGFNAFKPRPTEIKQEQFLAEYYPVLANDIAAAKAFLDVQPDCNSSNLILIGANDGATLGALWLNSECFRYRWLPPEPGLPQGSLDRLNPEGQAVTSAIWLTIGSKLGASKTVLNVAQMLDRPAKTFKVPMLFVYGEGDAKGKQIAEYCEKALVGKDKKNYPNTMAFKVAGAEQLTGKKLLLESLPTTDRIIKFLEEVPESKAAAKPRKASEEVYYWEIYDSATARMVPIEARKKGADRVVFQGYHSFLR